MSIWLDKVQYVSLEFWEEFLSFGDIKIESAGTYGKIVFVFLPSPKKLKKEIERVILNFRQD